MSKYMLFFRVLTNFAELGNSMFTSLSEKSYEPISINKEKVNEIFRPYDAVISRC